MYAPPSLWSLVEVLARLGPKLTPNVTISWYKNYHAVGERLDPAQSMLYLSSPSTCAVCQARVMDLLDCYRDGRDFGIVQELVGLDCECKQKWQSQVNKEEPIHIAERVTHFYAAIGSDILGGEWWAKHGRHVVEEMPARE